MGRTDNKIANGFKRRYQLIIRDVENFAEKSSPAFGYNSLIIVLFALFLLLASCSFWLSTTLLSKWLNPVHMEQKNKKELYRLAGKVETLEKETVEQANFIALLQGIIKGGDVSRQYMSQSNNEVVDSPDDSSGAMLEDYEDGVAKPISVASTIVNDDHSLTTCQNDIQNNLNKGVFFPPIAGHITRPFDKALKHYGVDIVGREKATIKSIAAGVVFFASWTVENGWVIGVQHHNLLSIYQHCYTLLKEVGSLVEAGDVIAIMGNSGELSTGDHLHFEVWHQGAALDPKQLIVF